MDAANEQPTQARWQEIESLFLEALAYPVDERRAFLEAACAGDGALVKEVAAMLAAHEEAADDYLEAMDADQATALLQETDSLEPDLIGPYRIVDELGQGGMGTVYLAERADGQFEQQVALKLIKRGMDSEAVLRRFLTERQILARLQHPNIARLLDGGLADDGRPYFVMECVEGRTITKYCDENHLSIEDRLRLFEGVCEAVHHAHSNLVIHRDLKPSNMLVTDPGSSPGQAPQVKLLDFGIAKVLGAETEPTMQPVTEAAFRVMTPEYAAPEQVRGEPVTTATDVYALGVVLYEMLTGRRPYVFDRRTPEVVAEVVCDTEPDRPSTAISRIQQDETGTTATSETISQQRASSPSALRRRLAGDLDTVVLKALRKEPENRYASAEAFVEDIKRHLAGLPVRARPQTVGYRAGKFVRRHRVATVAALLIVLLMLGYALTITVQARRIAAERDRTAQALAQAETVTDFLMGLFEANDPSTALGEDVTAGELLQRGVARANELAEEPLVQAQLLEVTGQVYSALGQYEQAQAQLEQALALRRAVHGEEHLDVAATLHSLGIVMAYRGDYDEAETLYRQALAMRRKLLGKEADPDVTTTLRNLAATRFRQGAYDEAETLLREVLIMDRKQLGTEHSDVAATLLNLANALSRQGAYEEAELLYREALAMSRKLLGAEHPQIAQALVNLAIVRSRQGAYEEAESLYREALAMSRKLLGAEHPQVAQILLNLANTMNWKGDYQEAESLYYESLALSRSLLGEEHPVVAMTLNNLGDVMSQQGVLDKAESLYREALAMRQRLLGPTHPHIARTQSNLADVLRRRGAYAEAEQLFLEAVPLLQERLGATHEDTRLACEHLLLLYADQERPPNVLCDTTAVTVAGSSIE